MPTGWTMVSRGQIYFVDLAPTRGREQARYRPVLVVASDAINRQVPRDYLTKVRVTAAETGLRLALEL